LAGATNDEEAAVAIATVDGLRLGYELIGDSGPAWVITPGGRFSKDHPGIREMATDLAACGYRVLIWDRPNCGESDVCFEGPSESEMQSDYLAGLLKHLELAPVIVAGGSAGARVSLITATKHPEVARALAMWWVTGGTHGYVVNASHYNLGSIKAAWVYGMEGVVGIKDWREVIERNPSNRQRILDQDRDTFLATFDRWMKVNLSRDDEIVPGLPEEEAGALTLPTVVVRSHPLDWVHLTRVTERIAAAVPNSTMIDWPPEEARQMSLELYDVGASALFPKWRILVPGLDSWARTSVL
jgi:pimeloyl-ACP methyl ester carboxylesterase